MLGNAIALGFTRGAFTEEYQVVYDSWTIKPDADVAYEQDTMVRVWIETGEWAEKDVIYVHAVHTNNNGEALPNWKNPGTNDATIVLNGGTMNFTAFEGFQSSDGAYVNYNWNPTDDGVNYVQDSSSVSAYIRTNVQEAGFDVSANAGIGGEIRLGTRWTSDLYLLKMNDNTDFGPANVDSRGFHHLTRTASNVRSIYKNKTLIGGDTVASINITNVDLFGLARNNSGSPDLPSTKQLSAVLFGGGMVQENVDNTTDPFETYMDSNGKGVIPEI